MQAALEVLKEAQQRDVRPVTEVLRAEQELKRLLQAAAGVCAAGGPGWVGGSGAAGAVGA